MRGKEMLRGTVISSGSRPFSTNVIFKAEKNDVSLHYSGKESGRLHLQGLRSGICDLQSEMIAAAFILQDKPVRVYCGSFYKESF